MPTSAEHSIRIGQGARFLAEPKAQEYANELVIAYFYTSLHMFEAALYDLQLPSRPRHLYTHGDRDRFLANARFDTTSPFFGLARSFETLRGISEQARYLSPAGSETYEPLTPNDVLSAKTLYQDIKKKLEEAYQNKLKEAAPWVSTAVSASARPVQAGGAQVRVSGTP